MCACVCVSVWMFVVVVTYVSSCRCVMSVCELFTCVVRGACQLERNTHENSSHYSLTPQSQHVNDTIDIPWHCLTMLHLPTRLLTKRHTCLPMCLPAYLHDCLHAGLPSCLLACLLGCLPACLDACLHACMSACLSDPPPQFTHKKEKCGFVGWCLCVQ